MVERACVEYSLIGKHAVLDNDVPLSKLGVVLDWFPYASVCCHPFVLKCGKGHLHSLSLILYLR